MNYFNPIPIKARDIAVARAWRADHAVHVEKSIARGGIMYPPSGSDCLRPEIWIAPNWIWLDSIPGDLVPETTP